MNGPEGEEQPGLPDEDRRFLKGIVVAILVVCAIGTLRAYTIATDVRNNSKAIAEHTDKIGKAARLDTRAGRAALYRICEREQRDRAEQQFRAIVFGPLTTKLLEQLHASPAQARALTPEAQRRRLPIFDCLPNLLGRRARPMSDRQQVRYVMKFGANKLDPDPAPPADPP